MIQNLLIIVIGTALVFAFGFIYSLITEKK
jgi:hypothetical protein